MTHTPASGPLLLLTLPLMTPELSAALMSRLASASAAPPAATSVATATSLSVLRKAIPPPEVARIIPTALTRRPYDIVLQSAGHNESCALRAGWSRTLLLLLLLSGTGQDVGHAD